MESLLVVSHVGLWTLTVFLMAAVWALARQVGLLHRRLAPAGARMEAMGPAVGAVAPELSATDLSGLPVSLGTNRAKPTLLVFVSPTCSTCAALMPAVRSLRRSEHKRLEVVLVGVSDDEAASRAYVSEHRLHEIPYVLSKAVADEYGVDGPPYAVLVGPAGRVQAKGLVNHLEHLESLLTAARLGHPSIESYLSDARPSARSALERPLSQPSA